MASGKCCMSGASTAVSAVRAVPRAIRIPQDQQRDEPAPPRQGERHGPREQGAAPRADVEVSADRDSQLGKKGWPQNPDPRASGRCRRNRGTHHVQHRRSVAVDQANDSWRRGSARAHGGRAFDERADPQERRREGERRARAPPASATTCRRRGGPWKSARPRRPVCSTVPAPRVATWIAARAPRSARPSGRPGSSTEPERARHHPRSPGGGVEELDQVDRGEEIAGQAVEQAGRPGPQSARTRGRRARADRPTMASSRCRGGPKRRARSGAPEADQGPDPPDP